MPLTTHGKLILGIFATWALALLATLFGGHIVGALPFEGASFLTIVFAILDSLI